LNPGNGRSDNILYPCDFNHRLANLLRKFIMKIHKYFDVEYNISSIGNAYRKPCFHKICILFWIQCLDDWLKVSMNTVKNCTRTQDRTRMPANSFVGGSHYIGFLFGGNKVNHPSLSEGACSVRSESNWLTRRH
jgi:hypothetical protein